MSAASVKEIKNRIKSIKSTVQITKAMELVASSKIRRVMETASRAKAYFDILSETLDDIIRDNTDFSSKYFMQREGKACRIVIAGDRGLAGGYNSNLFKSVDAGRDDIIFPIGKKAAERFYGYEIYTNDYEKAADVKISDCYAIGSILSKAYLADEFTSLYLSYTSFKNMLLQVPETVRLLPLDKSDKKGAGLTIYEPSAEAAFSEIVPNYISGMVYGAVCESVASEITARRNAMDAANKNASEMLDELKIRYNQARQSSVTQEITEIVSSTENI